MTVVRWHCISVKNATGVYDSLRKILLLTVSVVVLMVLIISVMLNRTNRWLRLSTSAKAESEAKSAFLSKMSHEIRTPINAMLGMNEMILRESKDEVILGYAHKAKTAGKSWIFQPMMIRSPKSYLMKKSCILTGYPGTSSIMSVLLHRMRMFW